MDLMDLANMKPFNVKEFAELTRTSEKTVRKACREGQIKALKVGKEWVISLESVRELI